VPECAQEAWMRFAVVVFEALVEVVMGMASGAFCCEVFAGHHGRGGCELRAWRGGHISCGDRDYAVLCI
jgi:hypothetical protein